MIIRIDSEVSGYSVVLPFASPTKPLNYHVHVLLYFVEIEEDSIDILGYVDHGRLGLCYG